MNIWLTTKNGFLGNELTKLFCADNSNLFLSSRNEVNLLNINDVNNYIKKNKIDIILHNAVKGGRRIKNDDYQTFYENILMFENIASNFNKVKKIINFDSAASFDRRRDINNFKENELGVSIPIDYYGLSKMNIALRTRNYNNIYNLRIFNCFGIEETPERMIRSNILKYINNNNLIVHKNKFMDFFFVEDLYTLLKYYINNNVFIKDINMVYNKKYTLKDICLLINDISTKKSDIIIEDEILDNSYTGNSELIDSLNLKFYGLEYGIKKMYNYYNKLSNGEKNETF